ncbi:MAG: hypothetical protein OES13_10135 [Acidimicrobiia bacterium]|nr:hypothetical protein [Acidimicrobiia bacterium]
MTLGDWTVIGAVLISIAVTPLVVMSVGEAWLLHVVRRVNLGDRLYRDVFFGAGPAPVWLAARIVAITRPQALVMRAITVAYLGAAWWVAVRTVVTEGAAQSASATLGIGLIALGGHHVRMPSHYGLWSSLWVLVAAAAVLGAQPLVGGLALAAATAGRYTVGAAAVISLLPSVLVLDGAVAAATTAAGIALGLGALALVMGREGVGDFYRGAVANKSAYLTAGSVTPLEGLNRAVPSRGAPKATWLTSVPTVLGFVVLAAAPAGVIVGFVMGITDPNAPALAGGSLCLVGLSVTYPRCDAPHVAAATGLALPGLWLVAEAAGILDGASPTAAAVLSAALVAGLAGVVSRSRRATLRRDVPRCKGLPVSRHRGVWPDQTDDLRAKTGGTVMVLHDAASFFYLSGSLINPTPYDYPYASTFGPNGQATTIEGITSGRIGAVCRGEMDSNLAPHELLAFVDTMRHVGDTPQGAVFRI